MSFTVPDWAIGEGNAFKISASDVESRNSPFSCPVGLSVKARQKAGSLRPNTDQWWRPEWDNASTLNFALRAGLTRLTQGDPIPDIVAGERNLTHAQRRFFTHALERLQDLISDLAEEFSGSLASDDDFSTHTPVDRPLYGTVTVWAQHLRTADSQLHIGIRLRLKPLRPQTEADKDWVAIAALTAAFDDASVPPTARVRLLETSLANGEIRVLFEGNRADAVAYNEERGRPVWDALDGTAYRPGAACASCAFLQVCPAVRSRRGVLGMPGRSVATRYLTSADLSAYDRCPTAFLAQRRDHLPDGYAETADPDVAARARDRGLAVHEWLRQAHSRTPARACSIADLPAPDAIEAGDRSAVFGIDTTSYTLAYPYLMAHVPHCPLALDGMAGWATERRTVMYDADADVLVISTPDLSCTIADSNEPIWRETKTTRSIPPDVEAAMQLYPAFALNIAMLAADVPARYTTAHAELEILTPDDGEVFYVSTSDGRVVARAQQLVADIARRFGADLTFDRKPSGLCVNCSAHRWCEPDLGGRLLTPPPDVDEFAGMDEPF